LNKSAVLIGIDIGTQGVRAIGMADCGELIASAQRSFTQRQLHEEQDPQQWWFMLIATLQSLVKEMGKLVSFDRIKALSATSTSGTVIPMNHHNEPLGPALMYSDSRSAEEARMCTLASERQTFDPAVAYHYSYGLPKMVWYTHQFPQQAAQIAGWCHATDFILGKLSGVWGITDYTNSLKTGYDLEGSRWPAYISEELGLNAAWFPKVVPSGTVIGTLDKAVAEQIGLPAGIQVVTGMTDGCASQVASGANAPGDWNTTIGTTLVVKGVTRSRIIDPYDRIYNHKHPQGYWMPGGSSNTGADWISSDYGTDDLSRLNEAVSGLVPTPWLSYPLKRQGERFPFLCDAARGFDPQGLTAEQLFAARLEGVAFIERLSYELVERLSGEPVSRIYSAGGGSLSDVWLQIRSSVMEKPILKMKHTEGATGAAIIAASGTVYSGLTEAAEKMVRLDKVMEPSPALVEAYDEKYKKFVDKLAGAGYLKSGEWN
jgi:sugar (pentulose or hexulose) kinase